MCLGAENDRKLKCVKDMRLCPTCAHADMVLHTSDAQAQGDATLCDEALLVAHWRPARCQ